jgi:hypothetical protein
VVRAAYEGVIALDDGDALEVTVQDKQAQSLTISAATETLVDGGTDTAQIPARNGATQFSVQLTATVAYTDGSSGPVDINDVTFTAGPVGSPATLTGFSLNAGANGLMKSGTGTGTQVIHASYTGGYSETVVDDFNVTVVAGNVETLTFVNADGTVAATSLVKGLHNEYAVQAKLVGSVALYWVTNDLTYASNNGAVVSIPSSTADGSITATAAAVGSAQLSAGGAGKVATLNVSVTEAEPVGIECAPNPICITVDDKAQVHVYANFTDGTQLLVTSEMIRSAYSVDNTDVADFLSQDPVGVVTGIAETGLLAPAEVSVTWGGFAPVTCDMYVVDDIESCDELVQ